MEGKYFIIEDGKVKITDQEKPDNDFPCEFESGCSALDIESQRHFCQCANDYAMEMFQFKQSGVEVGNVDVLQRQDINRVRFFLNHCLWSQLGKYETIPCPSGTTFEVREILSNGAEHDGQQCEYTMCYSDDHKIKNKCLGWCKQTAFVTFNKI